MLVLCLPIPMYLCHCIAKQGNQMYTKIFRTPAQSKVTSQIMSSVACFVIAIHMEKRFLPDLRLLHQGILGSTEGDRQVPALARNNGPVFHRMWRWSGDNKNTGLKTSWCRFEYNLKSLRNLFTSLKGLYLCMLRWAETESSHHT